ncbi:MAG: (2Fe-2S)-binding protein [Peptococcaceae bacterium]|jgi:carbon-monoxide dehydrogenase small subunit|nr:(2Fe-2S)-binding protein [Peptococcaceae bacterium]
MKDKIVLNINGKDYPFPLGKRLGQIPYSETLVQTLRERLGIQGTKVSCEHGLCGRCSVLIDGKAVASCMTLTADCDGKTIETIEKLQNKEAGRLIEIIQDKKTGTPDPLAVAIANYDGFKCQFCKAGVTIAVKSVFNKNPYPTESEIREGLSGNFCRLQRECGIGTQLVQHVRKFSSKA